MRIIFHLLNARAAVIEVQQVDNRRVETLPSSRNFNEMRCGRRQVVLTHEASSPHILTPNLSDDEARSGVARGCRRGLFHKYQCRFQQVDNVCVN